MTTLTIEIPDKVEKTLVDLIELLGGRIISIDSKTNSGEKQQHDL